MKSYWLIEMQKVTLCIISIFVHYFPLHKWYISIENCTKKDLRSVKTVHFIIPSLSRKHSKINGFKLIFLLISRHYINQYIWYNIYMEKDIFNIDKNKLSYGRGYVYSLQYHLVWCTKYRKKVLKNGIDTECKEMLQNLAEEYKFQILAMEVMPDHIHLLVDCKPQFYISDMIKIMKGNLARQMFLAYPELKKELWGGHLWNPSYCAITVSDRSRDQVLAYIEGQKEKEKKKA